LPISSARPGDEKKNDIAPEPFGESGISFAYLFGIGIVESGNAFGKNCISK
jgi:hypothetical protein